MKLPLEALARAARVGRHVLRRQATLEHREIGLVDVFVGVQAGSSTGSVRLGNAGARRAEIERVQIGCVDVAVAVEIARNEPRTAVGVHHRSGNRGGALVAGVADPSPSASCCPGLATFGQLSLTLSTASESKSHALPRLSPFELA